MPPSVAATGRPENLKFIALAGPTASGKTAVALAVARVRPVEIISVDSALVYRGMDIGTAKPSPAEQAAVPHHLIDILDPADSYSAAAFVADATRLIDEIRARGALPLLVGGTMLYFKALFDGIDAMLAAGFLDEVNALRARGDLSLQLPSMRCVGYRQAWEMLDACGSSTPDTKAMNELRDRGIAATRQLAKRQITWLRSMPARTVIACDAPDAVQTAVQRIATAE